MMERRDKKLWLMDNGYLRPIPMCDDTGIYRTTWKANGGFIIASHGTSCIGLCENIYESIKEDLFEWCQVHEDY